MAVYDNIPVLSWLVLGGRCRRCRQPISARYPAVELLTAGLFWGLCRRWDGALPWSPMTGAAAAALVAAAFIDWDTFLIPDELSVGLVVIGTLSSPWNPLFAGTASWRAASSLAGAAFGFGLCWATAALGEAAFKKEAMGGGDVKLLAGIGAWTGALGAFDSLVLAAFLGAVYGVSLIASGRMRRQDPIPFGPFLSAAAVFTLFYRAPLGWPVF